MIREIYVWMLGEANKLFHSACGVFELIEDSLDRGDIQWKKTDESYAIWFNEVWRLGHLSDLGTTKCIFFGQSPTCLWPSLTENKWANEVIQGEELIKVCNRTQLVPFLSTDNHSLHYAFHTNKEMETFQLKDNLSTKWKEVRAKSLALEGQRGSPDLFLPNYAFYKFSEEEFNQFFTIWASWPAMATTSKVQRKFKTIMYTDITSIKKNLVSKEIPLTYVNVSSTNLKRTYLNWLGRNSLLEDFNGQLFHLISDSFDRLRETKE